MVVNIESGGWGDARPDEQTGKGMDKKMEGVAEVLGSGPMMEVTKGSNQSSGKMEGKGTRGSVRIPLVEKAEAMLLSVDISHGIS